MDSAVFTKIQAFFADYPYHQMRKGEILIQAGEDPKGVFFLETGFVKEYTVSENGEEVILNLFKPGTFFPMSWAINKVRGDYYFEAVCDASFWLAPRVKTVAFVRANPDVLFDLVSRVYRGTDGLLAKLSAHMAGSAYQRLALELLISAKRFGKQLPDQSLIVSMSEKDLADRTGLTRETVSREMKRLKEKGVVVVTPHVFTLPSVTLLEDELGFAL